MTNRKTTRRALVLSLLSLLLCCSMLVGTTFAWFTDSVQSGNNKIIAGNLDVELYHSSASVKDPTPVKDEALFKDEAGKDILWEPGVVTYETLTVANEGTLDLKYMLSVLFTNENTLNGYGLSSAIKVGVVNEAVAGLTREQVVAKVSTWEALESFSWNGTLAALKTADPVTLVLYWEPTAEDNNWNANNGQKTSDGLPLHIDLGIELFATQLASEDDSFGPDYDKLAPWAGSADTAWYTNAPEGTTEYTVSTAEALAGLAKLVNEGTDTFAGKTVKLGANIDLNNAPWTPIGSNADSWNTKFNGIFDGNDYTISNLYVTGTTGLGLFGYVGNAAHIEDVTIDGAYVSGNDYVGAVVGTGYLAENCLLNCTVIDATIIATPYLMEDGVTYDGGAKAGAVAGLVYNGNISGNKAINCSVTAYRDLGGIVGMASGADRAITVSGNSVEGVTLTYVGVMGPYADNKTNENIGDVIGRVGVNTTVGTDNVATDSEKVTTGAIVISTAEELYAFAASVNGGNTYKGKTVMLGDNIDLKNAEWTPIGNSTNKFQGTFDGNDKTISNLNVNMPGKSNVGLFGFTTDGAIKNLTVENAKIVGRLNVGVVAGTPYTSKYTNITVKGNVTVDGMSYVGGVGGKNAYANWDVITVDVEKGSYVKAYSVENGTAYRTYVGGVVGFNGEGGHTFSNITSNIDVYGSTCDVGGAFGIAHYGNNFKNITVTGNVTITDAAEAADAEEMGGIAGVWHNADGSTVTFTNCKFDGKLTANFTDGVNLSDNTIVGKAYSASGDGKLIIDGATVTADTTVVDEALQTGGNVILSASMTVDTEKTTASSGYGATGVSVQGGTLDGNGYSLGINKWGTWDAAVHTTGGTIKNLTVNSGMRGIFMGSATADVYIDKVTIDGTVYTFNSDGGSKDYGVYISNSTLNGWTSHSDVHKEVVYTNCSFGEGRGYAFCRPYGPTKFVNCKFEEGFEFDTSKTSDIVFENCYYGDTLITAENAATLCKDDVTFFYNGFNGITIK